MNPKGKGGFQKGNQLSKKKMPNELKEYVNKITPEAMEFIYNTMGDENARIDIRVKCAENILDRGLGKPHQSSDVEVTGVSDIIENLRKRFE